jgi:monoamine oxidase
MTFPTRPLTRRAFLHALGAVGGAGAALAAMEALGLVARPDEYRVPFDPPRHSDFTLRGRVNDTTVVILGAGIAGLTAAYELEKAGYRCELIEARSRPGGRNWTVRGGTSDTDLDGVTQTARFADDLYMNAGPARIPQHHVTLEYCRELGVPIEVFANENAHGWYFNEEHRGATGPLAGRAVRQRPVKGDLTGYVSELLAKAVNRGALDEELTRDDAEALVELLRAIGALGPDDRYVGSDRRGYADPPGAGTRPGTTRAPYRLSALLQAQFGYYFPFEQAWDQAMLMFQPVGGMDRIPRALADRIRGRIRYGSEVRSIAATDDGVTVVFAADDRTGREIRADYGICTIPPPVLARIPSNFPEETRADLATLRTVPTAKMGLQFRSRFWEDGPEPIFGGITWTNLDIGTIWYPSSGYLTRRGIIVGYYNYFEDALEYDRLTPAERERRAIEQGRKVHGDAYLDEFETSFSAQWSRIRYSEGGWVNWPDRSGPARGLYNRLLAPFGRLYFAGDHLSYVTSWQHGAFESARLAVSLLHDRVLNA